MRLTITGSPNCSKYYNYILSGLALCSPSIGEAWVDIRNNHVGCSSQRAKLTNKNLNKNATSKLTTIQVAIKTTQFWAKELQQEEKNPKLCSRTKRRFKILYINQMLCFTKQHIIGLEKSYFCPYFFKSLMHSNSNSPYLQTPILLCRAFPSINIE